MNDGAVALGADMGGALVYDLEAGAPLGTGTDP
jgi:hypothetical protein